LPPSPSFSTEFLASLRAWKNDAFQIEHSQGFPHKTAVRVAFEFVESEVLSGPRAERFPNGEAGEQTDDGGQGGSDKSDARDETEHRAEEPGGGSSLLLPFALTIFGQRRGLSDTDAMETSSSSLLLLLLPLL